MNAIAVKAFIILKLALGLQKLTRNIIQYKRLKNWPGDDNLSNTVRITRYLILIENDL